MNTITEGNAQGRVMEVHIQEDAFRLFYENAELIFLGILQADENISGYLGRHKLQVCPSGCSGDENTNAFSVCWNTAPTNINACRTIEKGVTMQFDYLPDGHVFITLYPARANDNHLIEDSILLHRFCKATWLLQKRNQKALLRDFLAYTACTSPNSTSTLFQRIRISWVRYSRPIYINGVRQQIKVIQHIKIIIKIIFFIGLCGLIIGDVQNYIN